jgi:hypothetical protein
MLSIGKHFPFPAFPEDGSGEQVSAEYIRDTEWQFELWALMTTPIVIGVAYVASADFRSGMQALLLILMFFGALLCQTYYVCIYAGNAIARLATVWLVLVTIIDWCK